MKPSIHNVSGSLGWTGLLLLGVLAHLPLQAHAQAAQATQPAGPVVVSGVVPDEATRQAILGKVRDLYGRERVVDQLGVGAAQAPPNWADNVSKLLTPELKNVRRGQLRVSGNDVELIGETSTTAIREQIGASMAASLNPTYTVSNKLLVTEAPQVRIDNILANKIVEFESSSAVLTPVGQKVLDELLSVLSGLDGKRIQVIGHTDAVGSRPGNLALSQARAASVKDYLVARDLPAAAILILGVGPDQPITTNDSAEGRAKNRRIEFKVMP